ncbi:MAG: hypothetical protein RL684_1500, partial [Pseudomonadota bacterium]
MKFAAYSSDASAQRGDCLVLGAYEGRALPPATQAVDRQLGGRIGELLRAGDFAGKSGESMLLAGIKGPSAPRVLLVGLGGEAAFQRRAWKRAYTTAAVALGRTRIASATFALPAPKARDFDAALQARAAVEALGAANYRINDLKSGKRPPAPALARVRLGPFAASELGDARRGLAEGEAIVAASALLRNLGNLPGNHCTPSHLAAEARRLAKASKSIKAEVLERPALEKLGMGSFLSVTNGSAQPP